MSRCWRRSPGLLLLLVLAGGSRLAAQAPTRGELSGSIGDASGAPLYEVLVMLRPVEGGESRSMRTSRGGDFHFGFLPAGTYELRAEKIGYAPTRWTHIPVRPGVELRLGLTIPENDGQVLRTLRFEGNAAASGAAGAEQSVPLAVLDDLPAPLRTLGDLPRLFSRSDAELGVEGLPSSQSMVLVDGTPFREARLAGVAARPSFALAGLSSVALRTNPLDARWTGAAGGYLEVTTLAGSEQAKGEAAGFWSGSALGAPSFVGNESLSFNDVQGGVRLRAPIGEGRRVSAGFEGSRLETPYSPAWGDSVASGIAVLDEAHGLGVSEYRRASVQRAEAWAGFGRIDWRLSRGSDLEAGLQYATRPSAVLVDATGAALAEARAQDLVAGTTLRTQLSGSSANELRVSLTTSSRERSGTAGVPLTRLVHEGVALGGSTGDAEVRESRLQFADALSFGRGAHRIGLGVAASLGRHRWSGREGEEAEYEFGSVEDLLAGTGLLVREEGAQSPLEWTSTTISGFVQDRLQLRSGLEVLAALNVEVESVPDGVVQDPEWLRLTGIANDDVAGSALRLSPRVGLRWDIAADGRLLLDAGIGIHHDRYDPAVLARWQRDDGSVQVRRVAGDLTWPPEGAAGGNAYPRLTVLADDFEAPRTARASIGVTRLLGSGAALQLSGAVRRTTNLPRRTDLNLLPVAAAHDQHGREVYGALAKIGGSLYAEPGSNRRFPTYDEVAAISTNGTSQYWGVTVGVAGEPASGMHVHAGYTFSRTTDDWPGASAGGWRELRPGGVGAEDDATADLDVPHRGIIGIAWQPTSLVRVSALYRVESGLPFTPGFRPGVDANADGASNDPAFIDTSIAGMDAVLSRWPCLREASGTFAERNSCRTELRHALDAGIAVSVLRSEGVTARLTLDGFDLLETEHTLPDDALFLLDPAAALIVDTAARTVTLPLLVNPGFGEPLVRRNSGRKFRLGLSVSW